MTKYDLEKLHLTKRIEDRNQVLVQSVRQNINKIDKIVSRLVVPPPLSFSRMQAQTISHTAAASGEERSSLQLNPSDEMLMAPPMMCQTYRVSADAHQNKFLQGSGSTNNFMLSNSSNFKLNPIMHSTQALTTMNKNKHAVIPITTRTSSLRVQHKAVGAKKNKKTRQERSLRFSHKLQRKIALETAKLNHMTQAAATLNNSMAEHGRVSSTERDTTGQDLPPSSVITSPNTFICDVNTSNLLVTSGFKPVKLQLHRAELPKNHEQARGRDVTTS